MGVLNFFRKSEQGDNILVLDIESDSIKSAIINIDNAKKRFQITAFHKEWREAQFLGSSVVDSADLKSNIQKSIINLLRKRKSTSFKKMIVVSGNEIFNSDLFNVEFTRENPEKKIDMGEIKEDLQKSFDKIQADITQNKINQEFATEDTFKIVDGTMQNVLVDGYPVASPLGFQGKKITLNIFSSYLPLNFFELFEELAKSLDVESWELKHRIGLLAEFWSNKTGKENAIFINIGSYFTELLLVKNKQILSVDSFAMGGASFTRLLASQMGIGFIEAEDIKLKYSRKSLKRAISDKITNLLSQESEFFINQLGNSMKQLLGNELMTENVYISGGGALLPELREMTTNANNIFKELPALSPVKYDLISIENDAMFLKSGTGINQITDTSIIISGFLSTKITEPNGLNSLFKNLIKYN